MEHILREFKYSIETMKHQPKWEIFSLFRNNSKTTTLNSVPMQCWGFQKNWHFFLILAYCVPSQKCFLMVWKWSVISKRSRRIWWRRQQWLEIKTKIFANIFTKAFERMLLGSHSTSYRAPGLCVVQGIRNLTPAWNGVWSLWQTIGQKWRLKCFALSLVIGNYRKNRLWKWGD